MEYEKFRKECEENIASYINDDKLQSASKDFIQHSNKSSVKYSYNFEWLGRPIIQYPQDIVAMQEIIWKVKPDIIIETGIAHGGSLIFSASMLSLLELCGEIKNGKVVAVDIDIRSHNRTAIEEHPMSKKIEMIEGSSIDPQVVKQVKNLITHEKKVLVCLDSNHTHDHVLEELRAYAPLVSKDSYCVVFDTIVEDIEEGTVVDRPWGKGNNPKTAVREFLKENQDFEIDKFIDQKLLISQAPQGFLFRKK